MKRRYSYEEAVDEVRSRIGYGCSASALAEKCGVSQSMVSEILSGKKTASLQTMKKLGYDVVFVRRKRA